MWSAVSTPMPRRVVEAVAEQHDLRVRTVGRPPRSTAAGVSAGGRATGCCGRQTGWDLGGAGAGVVLGRVSSGDGFASTLGLLARVLLGRDRRSDGLDGRAVGGSARRKRGRSRETG